MRTFSVSNRMGAIAVIAAAAIALAACGGGGGLNEDEAAGLRDEVKAAEAAQAAAEAARAAAAAEAEAARTAQAAAEAAKQAAEAEAAAAEAAKEAAEAQAAQQVADARAAQAAAEAAQAQAEADKVAAEARSAEEVAEANRQAEQARMEKEAAEADATTAREARDAALAAQTTAEREKAAAERLLATAQQQLRAAQTAAETARQAAERARLAAEQQQEQLQQQLTEAQQAELSARAAKYIEAINDGGGAAPRTGVTVTYQRGSTLKINPGGNFQTGTGAPAISGFRPYTYTRQVGSKQTVYLYTNIQAPGTRAFWKEHGLEVAAGSLVDANSPKPTEAPQFITAPEDNTMATGVRVRGTYDGVSGTFTCEVSGTCVGAKDSISLTSLVPVDDRVRSLATVGSWSFKPGSITGGIRKDQDTEFLYFGIWADEPDLASGEHDYEYIVGGSGALGAEAFGTLSGTATFKGGAVGKYVTRSQVGQSAKIGTFTAAANFTATFGDGPTLEGTIADFRDGSQALTGWSVHLGGGTADTPSNAPIAFAEGTVTDGIATARIGGVSATGTWDATLHGTNNPGRSQLADADDAATRYPLSRYPQADLAGLVGNFHATNDTTAAEATAAIAGAFAATPSSR